jgi:hypothetical protein
MRRHLVLLALLASSLAQAQWQFQPGMDIAAGHKVFHHLEASGGRALALSGQLVGLAWEDDRSGVPRCYLALRVPGQAGFGEHAFGQGECFAPAVAGLSEGRFALIWEDESGVQTALAGPEGIGAPIALAPAGGQGTLAWHPRWGLFAAWSSPEGKRRRVWRAQLQIAGGRLVLATPAAAADAAPPADDQTYPVLAAGEGGVTLAWEDRRHGHTVVFASHSPDGGDWGKPARISQNPTGRINNQLGRGTGAMRPALAAYGASSLAAVWLDKRDFLSGYDVYASLSQDNGKTFGANQKAQDSFGDAIAQWHATAAGNDRGDLVIAWDDDRDGTPDIWLTWKTAAGFAENLAPPPAAGPGSQSDPVVALDEQGNLHLAWNERGEGESSRLRYSLGKRRP